MPATTEEEHAHRAELCQKKLPRPANRPGEAARAFRLRPSSSLSLLNTSEIVILGRRPAFRTTRMHFLRSTAIVRNNGGTA